MRNIRGYHVLNLFIHLASGQKRCQGHKYLFLLAIFEYNLYDFYFHKMRRGFFFKVSYLWRI